MKNKKNPAVDLEKKRPALFLLGLSAAMSVTLMAFEWRTTTEPVEADIFTGSVGLPLEYVPPVPNMVKPPSTETKVVKESHVFKLVANDEPEVTKLDESPVDNEESITHTEHIDFDPEPNDLVSVPPPPVLVSNVMPSFPGGTEEMMKFLGRNTDYPDLAKEVGIEGVVFVSFIVEKDGSVSQVKVLKGIGGGCDEEAVRVVKSMPKWTPGHNDLDTVRVVLNLPYHFKLID